MASFTRRAQKQPGLHGGKDSLPFAGRDVDAQNVAAGFRFGTTLEVKR